MSRFDSVLVANRGEIAVRVLRSARDQGYRTIAVFSDADRHAPHVAMADEAVYLGPSPVHASYLNGERILDAARRSGAGAIHPGYGFLSENAGFATACIEAGLVFIGPDPRAIELMGNKAAAKRHMLGAGVPCVPGYQGAAQDDEALLRAARDIGLPLMVKAAAGGGGRGMRLVEDWESLPAALAAARSEAENAFGSDELILERALRSPRHVEVQVFGDEHGSLIHLGERDCSVQRRHQKVLEEAPCPVLAPQLRQKMGVAAVAAAESIGYVNAGTVEFLLDADSAFYFLEMNTRLQVEHPVTEAITGLDLVALQLQVAQGGTLPLAQEDLVLKGHAIEVRLYAEDVSSDFLPATGTVRGWVPPAGVGVRVDHGLAIGQVISPFYDPMLGKLIARGADREEARRRLRRALRDTVLFGVPNNRMFLLAVLEDAGFAAGTATTAFVAECFADGLRLPPPAREILCCAALLQFLHASETLATARLVRGPAGGVSGVGAGSRFAYLVDGELCELRVESQQGGEYAVETGGRVSTLSVLALDAAQARIAVDGYQRTIAFCAGASGEIELQCGGQAFVLRNTLSGAPTVAEAVASGQLRAPMHGRLLRLRAAAGDRVSAGDELAVIEAMKMEHRLLASAAGVVAAVHAVEGNQLTAGAVVLDLDLDP